MTFFLVALFLVPQCLAFDYLTMEEVFQHTGASGTQHNKDLPKDDPNYYESNSFIPNLPTITGFMGTHGTYRFLSIHEQTAVLIGEGKHGMWRVHDNGFIREYRKKGTVGIKKDIDPNNLHVNRVADQFNLRTIGANYSHFIPEESWSGYKYPDEKISDEGYLNFIDLSIYHPKYEGKYEDHVPIELPLFYCTMTQNDYKHLGNTWKYATKQPMANKMGPLAVRAGMDIKENYFNVLRFDFFADAGIWANVGTGASSDYVVKTLDELKSRYQTINYQRMDMTKVDLELYLFERPFFNNRYIFVSFVMDTKAPANRSDYAYIRPSGSYYEGLLARGKTVVKSQPQHFPKVYVENYPTGLNSVQKAYATSTYGHHNPLRRAHKLTGGACPGRGGDWGRYPWSNAGAGFAANYEEIAPICDAFVLDIKMWANLQVPSWNDLNLFLGNGGYDGDLVVNYTADANLYGKYTDPYLANATNPFEMDLTGSRTIVEPGDVKLPSVNLRLHFNRTGTYLGFNKVSLDSDTASHGRLIMNNFSLLVVACIIVLAMNNIF